MLFVRGVSSGAQVAEDVASVIASRPEPQLYRVKREDPSQPVDTRQTSEVKLGLLVALKLYQISFSSLDLDRCNFRPSCSRYAVESVRKSGIVRGILASADRLLRDHGLPAMARQYSIDLKYGKFNDPPDHSSERHRAAASAHK